MRRLAALLLVLAAHAPAAAPLRVLIFSGQNNHDWRTTTPFLKKLLLDTGRFDVRVSEEPGGITARTLASYDAIVLDYQGRRWGDAAEKAVVDFVRSGKGLVAVHAASYAFSGLEVLGDRHVGTGIFEPAWKEYFDMLGGTWTKSPKTGHAPRHTFTVKITKPEHPIVRGMPPSFRAGDELYHQFKTHSGINVIATAFDNKENGGTGRDEPMLWTVNYGNGRVFHTALGHDVAAMQEAGFVNTFVRGVEWAATGQVTLPPDVAPLSRDANPVRIMVVTGGHDHDGTFYGVLEGYRDFVVNVNPHPVAYRGDLREKYDVLVLYDTVQEVGERQRENLRAFVEAGKGLVVTHHAIADFVDWPWWYEEVVGGRYLLNADKGMPASTYKHDEEQTVTPVGKHPITAGLGSMHIIDETYKGMWISPKVNVLLKTDSQTSDGPVAWISPYENSRVVFIELGHDRKAHEHTGFRQLMRNAVLWAAGRTE